ncbi:hypothetical protein GX51_06297 [Blastomyces parvus]|uniref:Uncharacterized protein n=1 Tax=Blastomyces parvus TaxID=2060905 RepID=A0A2B7WSM9_9EURO|nr:hypothetical protein GX51_06297 [Blastomyces parvus]
MSGAGKRRRQRARQNSASKADNGNSSHQSHAQFDGTSGPGSTGHRPGMSSPLASPRARMNSPPGSPRAGSPAARGRSPGPGTPTFGSIAQRMETGNLPLRDPARDPERIPKLTDMCRNIDLPADAYQLNPEPNIFPMTGIVGAYLAWYSFQRLGGVPTAAHWIFKAE